MELSLAKRNSDTATTAAASRMAVWAIEIMRGCGRFSQESRPQAGPRPCGAQPAAPRRGRSLEFHAAGPHACPMADPLDAYSAAVVGAVERVGPAVVSVYVGSAAEAERARGGAGSGVVVTPDGYLLTNEHVVQRVTEARITFVDGRNVP